LVQLYAKRSKHIDESVKCHYRTINRSPLNFKQIKVASVYLQEILI